MHQTDEAATQTAEAHVIPLREMLCLALHRASRAMTAQYRPLLAAHGITYPQYLVIALLHQEGTLTVGGVGDELGLESSTLSPLLSRLAERGLVTRTRSTDDERRVEVSLTAEGRELGEQLEVVPFQVCQATGLTPTQAREVVAQLSGLVDQLERAAAV
ncbi:DNA-binding transcriptional regulator, MarR family [Quadrisphaera granulorum]|uniref:DNA-binding MarR family transcriptional regulator n=1 Tax=Quadrisphaera granulorum TaxID=317664 RepID=A0A316A8I5_9ACTN|nr:MarR family transcriptional regulator [Quadrisphaera granulorum]PWJ53822.1 DNA-binding MarR family transcriptional regulator [Quadrisphaera granulorum]SZE96579.1 DNA-binding transcriptional regulator, MarR family [Quadrisphaera granulorum]